MGAPRKVDDSTLAELDKRLRCRHHLLLVMGHLGLTMKGLAEDLGVHPETIRRRDYQLHGYAQRDPDIKAKLKQALNQTHLVGVSPD